MTGDPCDEFEGKPLLQKKCREDPRYREAIDRGWRPHKTKDYRPPKKQDAPDEDFADVLHELGADDEDTTPKSLLQMWKKWRRAIKKWKKAGKPKRTDEEVAQIIEICSQCEHLGIRFGLMYCEKCTCSLGKSQYGSLNKARMATESCPLKPPKWEAICPRCRKAYP